MCYERFQKERKERKKKKKKNVESQNTNKPMLISTKRIKLLNIFTK